MTGEAEENKEFMPDRGQILEFLEAESSRADTSHRYLITIVSISIVGIYYIVNSLPLSSIQIELKHWILIGLGAGIYVFLGSKLASRFVDLLFPRRMIYAAYPAEASIVAKWVDSFGVPLSWRFFLLVDSSSYILYMIFLIISAKMNLISIYLVSFAIIISLPGTMGRFIVAISSTKSWLIRQYLMVRVAIWERIAEMTGEGADNRFINDARSKLDGTRFAPTRETAKFWLIAYNFIDKIGTTISFLVNFLVMILTAISIWKGDLEIPNLEIANQFSIVALISLTYLALFGSLWIYLDPFRAQLGQLRLYTLLTKESLRYSPLIFVCLEALRELRLFYSLPLGAFIPAIQEARQDAVSETIQTERPD